MGKLAADGLSTLRLTPKVRTNRQHVIAAGQRALSVLRQYRPAEEGQAILVETAIEQTEDLVRGAGGDPT